MPLTTLRNENWLAEAMCKVFAPPSWLAEPAPDRQTTNKAYQSTTTQHQAKMEAKAAKVAARQAARTARKEAKKTLAAAAAGPEVAADATLEAEAKINVEEDMMARETADLTITGILH